MGYRMSWRLYRICVASERNISPPQHKLEQYEMQENSGINCNDVASIIAEMRSVGEIEEKELFSVENPSYSQDGNIAVLSWD